MSAPLIIKDDCNISIGMSWLNFIVGTQTPSLLRNKTQHGDHLLAGNVIWTIIEKSIFFIFHINPKAVLLPCYSTVDVCASRVKVKGILAKYCNYWQVSDIILARYCSCRFPQYWLLSLSSFHMLSATLSVIKINDTEY